LIKIPNVDKSLDTGSGCNISSLEVGRMPLDYKKHVREILVSTLPGLSPTDNQIRVVVEILKRNDECRAAEDQQ
jgi:hypothetical protein